MANQGYDEGFQVIEEFTCEAIAESGPNQPGRGGRGENEGMQIVTEFESSLA